MRVLLLLCTLSLTVGCASTQVIEANWDQATVAELNTKSKRRSLWHTTSQSFKTTQFIASPDSMMWRPRVRGVRAKYLSRNVWHETAASDIDAVSFTRRDRKRGFLFGVVPGAAVGGLVVGGIADALGYCEPLCPPGHTRRVILAGVGRAIGGGLVTGLLGALFGTKETNVYRFRPDTPQQMSVVIGVGPTTPVHIPMK